MVSLYQGAWTSLSVFYFHKKISRTRIDESSSFIRDFLATEQFQSVESGGTG